MRVVVGRHGEAVLDGTQARTHQPGQDLRHGPLEDWNRIKHEGLHPGDFGVQILQEVACTRLQRMRGSGVSEGVSDDVGHRTVPLRG